MKIGFDARMISWSGVGRYTEELLSALSRIDGENNYVVYCHREDVSLVPEKSNFKTRTTKHSVLSPINLFIWNFLLKRDDLDVFHSPQYPLPFFRSIPFVVTIHDLIPLIFPETMPSKIKRWYYHTLNKNAVKKADKIITVSKSTKMDLIKQFNVDGEGIEVTPIASDAGFEKIENEQSLKSIIEKYDISDKFIFAVGNSKPHKNWKTLIKGYSRIDEGIQQKYDLVFLGEKNSYFFEILTLVEELNLENNITFLENVSEKDLVSLYNAADIFVQPSLYEGFGLPVLEAQNCGTSVICSNTSSLPEVAGEGALYVNPEKADDFAGAITKLAKSDSLNEKLQEKALNNSNSFSWEKTARRTLNIYKQVYRENLS